MAPCRPAHVLRFVASVTALLVCTPIAISAQQTQGRAAAPGRGTIIGVVVDTLGQPIGDVTVFINGRTRTVVTGDDGTFRFDNIATDTSTIATRRIGYYPGAKRVSLGDRGASVVVELVPRSEALPAVITEARATGLSGVVSDTAFNALPDAQVEVIGGVGGIVTTDSTGSFYADVNPGHYMVRVMRKGFQPEMVGVTVPPAGGRRLAVRLMPGTDPYHAREAVYSANLKLRLDTLHPAWSRILTREDIARMRVLDVSQAATMGAVQRVEGDCMARVNGGMSVAPIWSFDPDEIEMLEIYVRGDPATGSGTARRGVTSISGSAAIRTQSGDLSEPAIVGNPAGCPTLYVWTSR